MHLLGKTIKQAVHSVTRGAYFGAQARSNVFRVPEPLRVITLILRGEGAPETLMGASCLLEHIVSRGCLQVRVVTRARCFSWMFAGASGHSSTLFLMDVCRCEWSLEHFCIHWVKRHPSL